MSVVFTDGMTMADMNNPKPVRGIEGKQVKLKFRPNAWPMAYVKEPAGVVECWIDDHEDHWTLTPRAKNIHIDA